MGAIKTFLGAAGLGGIRNYIWLIAAVLVALVFVAVVTIADNAVEDSLDRAGKQGEAIGAQGATIAGQNQTLDQLGDANNAEQDLRRGGERNAVAYDECLRNNRRPGACERYNPNPRE